MPKKINPSSLKVLDLFAGGGGFARGFEMAGLLPGVMIDNCEKAVETLECNFSHNGGVALHRDLSKFNPITLEREAKQQGFDTDFNIIVGGPPCQGWSQVGRGKLKSLGIKQKSIFDDSRNHLFKRFIDFVDFYQPQVAIMENVPGMLSHSGQNVAEMVAKRLERVGYRVTWKLLNSNEYGVPQIRQRLFFIGMREDLKVSYQFPKPLTPLNSKKTVTVSDAIRDLPAIRNGTKDWIRDYDRPNSLSAFGKLMRQGAVPGKVFDHVCRTHNNQDLEAFRFLKQGGWYRDLPKRLKRYRDDIFEDKYKKLVWAKPSWCVTAHLSKDCYTHIHPSQARTISIREAARLQSFPDRHYFAGNVGDKFRAIGNAVPPIMARNLILSVLEQAFTTKLGHHNRHSSSSVRLEKHL
jgi:DNA (cytosine-5)-methyltransferase 1